MKKLLCIWIVASTSQLNASAQSRMTLGSARLNTSIGGQSKTMWGKGLSNHPLSMNNNLEEALAKKGKSSITASTSSSYSTYHKISRRKTLSGDGMSFSFLHPAPRNPTLSSSSSFLGTLPGGGSTKARGSYLKSTPSTKLRSYLSSVQ